MEQLLNIFWQQCVASSTEPCFNALTSICALGALNTCLSDRNHRTWQDFHEGPKTPNLVAIHRDRVFVDF